MELAIAQLRATARLLDQDLARTTDGSWQLDVDDNAMLHVRHEGHHDVGALDRELNTGDYVLRDALAAGDENRLNEALGEYAAEVVWIGLSDVLWARGIDWPLCSDHPSRRLDVCLGTWYCEGGPSHDVGEIGQLPRAGVT